MSVCHIMHRRTKLWTERREEKKRKKKKKTHKNIWPDSEIVRSKVRCGNRISVKRQKESVQEGRRKKT